MFKISSIQDHVNNKMLTNQHLLKLRLIDHSHTHTHTHACTHTHTHTHTNTHTHTQIYTHLLQ